MSPARQASHPVDAASLIRELTLGVVGSLMGYSIAHALALASACLNGDGFGW